MRDLAAEWTKAARRGDFAAAWAVSDAVLAARDPPHARRSRLALSSALGVGRPRVRRPARPRPLLSRLGDTIQFARYLPALRARVASLAVEAQAELLPLLERVPGPDRLIPFAPAAPAPPSECDIEIMELAHALRLPPSRARRPTCAPIRNPAPA